MGEWDSADREDRTVVAVAEGAPSHNDASESGNLVLCD